MWCVSKWARHALLWCCYKSLSRAERRVRGISSHTVAFIISFIINAINKIQSFIYIICLCHYVTIYEGSLSCDYQLLRKKGRWGCFFNFFWWIRATFHDDKNGQDDGEKAWKDKLWSMKMSGSQIESLFQDFDTKAPLLLLRSWAALSHKVSLSVFYESLTPGQISTFFNI